MGRPIEEVRQLLEDLPDDSSFEDVQYHIYVRQKVASGLAAAERCELVDQHEIEQRMARWLGK